MHLTKYLRKITLLFSLGILCVGLTGCATNKNLLLDEQPDMVSEETSSAFESIDVYQKLDYSLTDKANLDKNIVEKAKSQLGKRYKFGGTRPETGFDCSGLIQWSYSQHGIKVPRSTRELIKYGVPVKVENARPGDIIIFSSFGRRSGYHAGLITEEDSFIHSPRTGKNIRIESYKSAFWKPKILSVRRVIGDIPPDHIAQEPLLASLKPTKTAAKSKTKVIAKNKKAKKKVIAKKKTTSKKVVVKKTNRKANKRA